VPHLWQLTKPDILVYLDASLSTIRRRRSPRWERALLEEQRRRLSHARRHCDLYIPTDGLAPADVASRVVTYLANHKPDRQKAQDENRQLVFSGDQPSPPDTFDP
jgi:hypothetical protein